MTLVEVNSSNISKVGLENKDLLVEYKSGVIYRYKDVGEDTYKKLLESDSKGRFMNTEIKNKYEYVRV